MKKKIIFYVLCLTIASLPAGCGNTQQTGSESDSISVENETNDESNMSESENEDNESESQESESLDPEDILLRSRNPTMDGYMIVTPYIQVILTNEGTVLSRGINTYGQLGNGERVNSETWVEVKGVENVVGIYSVGSVGSSRDGEYSYGSIYALTDTGELYRWGGNILTPEKVTFLPTIREIKQFAGDLLVICESGEKYLITPRYNRSFEDGIYSCDSLPDNIEFCVSFSYSYLIYYNNQLALYYVPSFFNRSCDSFGNPDAIESLDNWIEKITPIEITEPIESMTGGLYYDDITYGATLCNESGEVTFIGIDPYSNEVITHDLGGSGIKKAFLDNDTTFLLFSDWTLEGTGENKYGQLGDGTTIDYFGDYLTIDEALFFDFSLVSDYCIGLDPNFNVWGWGDGFGSTPEIIIANSEFIVYD